MISKVFVNATATLLLSSLVVLAEGPEGALVGYWKLSEGEGSVAADSSGHGNEGRLRGNPHWEKDTIRGVTRGTLGFDGTDDYIDCGSGDSLNLNGRNFTLMAWIYAEGPGSLLSKELGGQNWPEYALSLTGNRTLQSAFWNANTPLGGGCVTSGALSFRKWYHVAATHVGSTDVIYIDGVQRGRTDGLFGSPYSGSNKLFIGAVPSIEGQGFAGTFRGRLAEVAVFSRCLSRNEVRVCFTDGVMSLKTKPVTETVPGLEMVRGQKKEETAATKRSRVKTRKRLFLDDYEIEEMRGLERKFHQPVKFAGNPVLKPKHRWEDITLQSRTPPQWVPEERVWKIWYLASETRWEGEPEAAHICYAFSRDGLHWEKPRLGVFTYHGSAENNIIADSYMLNLIHDPEDTVSYRRYKGLAGALERVPVVSKEGIRWRALGAPGFASGDESFMTCDEASGRYLATVKVGGPYGRCVALSASEDFWNWTKPELLFHADERDQAIGRQRIEAALADPGRLVPRSEHVVPEKFRTDVYNMALFPYEGLYLGLPCIFDQTGPLPDGNEDGFLYVELVSSRDLKNWHRVADRAIFIGSGPKGSYDCGMVLSAGRPILHDNELWFYYNGFSITHSATGPEPRSVGSICLARMRLDGFVSLEAGESEGNLLTKPLVVNGTRLCLNADAAQGEIQAEIVDEKGRALPGFSAGECLPFRGDNTKGEIRWKGKRNLSALTGREVRIRFSLQKASFYAFWFAG